MTKIAYVVSQYPARSETFIAREMKELVRQGDSLLIARLRWSDTNAGMQIKPATVLSLKWNPLDWIFGVWWGLSHAPRTLLYIGRDLFLAFPLSPTWWRLFILSLVTLALARDLASRKPHHLRAHFLDSEAIVAHWMSRLLDVPYSTTAHTLHRRFPEPLLRRVVDGASFCAAISKETASMLRGISPHQHVSIIRNGLPTSPLSFSPSSFHDPTWTLLAVGRLVSKKGFDVLLEACGLLHHWSRPFRCTLIGDGPLRQPLEAKARRLHLDNRVRFRGPQSNDSVFLAIRNHDVLVMPSRPTEDGHRDGIPTVLIEAMSQGIPVVASAFAGIPELVEDGETGRLVPPNNPIALARTLRDLFDNPQRAALLGKQGRERIRKEFNLPSEVQKLRALIRNASSHAGNS